MKVCNALLIRIQIFIAQNNKLFIKDKVKIYFLFRDDYYLKIANDLPCFRFYTFYDDKRLWLYDVFMQK